MATIRQTSKVELHNQLLNYLCDDAREMQGPGTLTQAQWSGEAALETLENSEGGAGINQAE